MDPSSSVVQVWACPVKLNCLFFLPKLYNKQDIKTFPNLSPKLSIGDIGTRFNTCSGGPLCKFLLLVNRCLQCISPLAEGVYGGSLSLWAAECLMTMWNVCGHILECVLREVEVVMTCKAVDAGYLVSSCRVNITWDPRSLIVHRFVFCIEYFWKACFLIKMIITLLLCWRSCEKMNVVKENKDLACFYTTKHSWRGK